MTATALISPTTTVLPLSPQQGPRGSTGAGAFDVVLEGAVHEGAVQDGAVHEGAVQDGAVQDEAVHEHAPAPTPQGGAAAQLPQATPPQELLGQTLALGLLTATIPSEGGALTASAEGGTDLSGMFPTNSAAQADAAAGTATPSGGTAAATSTSAPVGPRQFGAPSAGPGSTGSPSARPPVAPPDASEVVTLPFPATVAPSPTVTAAPAGTAVVPSPATAPAGLYTPAPGSAIPPHVAAAPLSPLHAAASSLQPGTESPVDAVAPNSAQGSVAQGGAPALAAAPASPAPGNPHLHLVPQLTRPLFTLFTAPQGGHTLILKVTPEDLGPLTVRAQIDAAGVRIELFAPGDAGRDAVRSVLPQLRRELSDAGFGASLELSDRNGPADSGRSDSGSAFSGRSDPWPGGRQEQPGRPAGAVPARDESPPGATGEAKAVLPDGTATTLDILV